MDSVGLVVVTSLGRISTIFWKYDVNPVADDPATFLSLILLFNSNTFSGLI